MSWDGAADETNAVDVVAVALRSNGITEASGGLSLPVLIDRCAADEPAGCVVRDMNWCRIRLRWTRLACRVACWSDRRWQSVDADGAVDDDVQ